MESNSDVAVNQPIRCKRGDTFWRGFEYYSDASYSVPIDITASTFKMDVSTANGITKIFSLTLGDGLTITAPNILEITISAEDMEVNAGTYKYDLEKTLVDGTVTTIMEGSFTVDSDLTPVP